MKISKEKQIEMWNALKVSLDASDYGRLMEDPKVTEQSKTIYVEEKDPFAFDFYSKDTKESGTDISVEKMPIKPTAEFVASVKDRPGLVASVLINNEEGVKGMPYVCLGGEFTELDTAASYFTVLALLKGGHIELARQIANNITYMIGHVNSLKATNRSYHQHVPALPLYTSMIKAIALTMKSEEERRAFLKNHIMRGILEYERVWEHQSSKSKTGLNRFPKTDVDPKTLSFEIPDAKLLPVRLNMMLYVTENDLAHFIGAHTEEDSITVGDKTYNAAYWKNKADSRLKAMKEILWDKENGTFYDFDESNSKFANTQKASFIYALWANAADNSQLNSMLDKPLQKHTSEFGLHYNLNDKNIQAPEQLIFWLGLKGNKKTDTLKTEVEKWQAVLLPSFNENGTLAKAYTVADGKPAGGASGTVFGWTLASAIMADSLTNA